MRVLVTGGLGFIGSNFILHVLQKYPNYKVTNIDAELEGSNKKNLVILKNNNNYTYVKGNINNKKLIEKLVSRSDVVFNFAAESHVDRSITNPKSFVDSNIYGTYNILESIRKFKKKFIQISTDEVFGSLKSGSADEKYPYNPSSPYAATKASSEMLVQSYITTYDCDAMITRCTNNYGPMQNPEKLIPKTIILANKNEKIPIYGTGKNIRDWIYVWDHCNAILKIFSGGKSGQSYNISNDNEISNITIVRKILEIMGKSYDLIHLTKDRPGHDFRYSLNSKKIRKELRWKPEYNFEKGLEFTVKWYLDNNQWWKNTSGSVLNAYDWKTR
ncbi:MAG TPA: dTDP-glucose 4,6-dehydratase [Candidatus Nitrosotalea sp.]|nr:dTDP-glucose 4,6-dehydratase [Candidatus Nitrosotalea sp.]